MKNNLRLKKMIHKNLFRTHCKPYITIFLWVYQLLPKEINGFPFFLTLQTFIIQVTLSGEM